MRPFAHAQWKSHAELRVELGEVVLIAEIEWAGTVNVLRAVDGPIFRAERVLVVVNEEFEPLVCGDAVVDAVPIVGLVVAEEA